MLPFQPSPMGLSLLQGRIVRNLTQLLHLPMPGFLFRFPPQGGIWSSQSLTYLCMEGEGVEAGVPPFRTSKWSQPPLALGGRSGGGCPVSMWVKSSSLQRGRHAGSGGLEAGLGSSCPEWKQTPTPNQTQIEIPGGTGCPKPPQARLGQGGSNNELGAPGSPGECGSQA